MMVYVSNVIGGVVLVKEIIDFVRGVGVKVFFDAC